jgi:uncharacterized alkaline shock family protein YloU
MTEAEQRQKESPLLSDRGVTRISDTVVSRIAGMAAQEVPGVHMGGSASRTAGGILGGVTGSDSQTRGISVEVGSVEVAMDLKMGVDYGRNILETVGEVRRRISERVPAITGLHVTELNVTISDIVLPENGGQPRQLSQPATGSASDSGTRPTSRSETGDRATARPTGSTSAESRDEDETTAMRTEEDRTEEIDRRQVSEERRSRRRGTSEES